MHRASRRTGRVVWAVLWSALIWSIFTAVTVLTVWLWMANPGNAETTPVGDLSFFALGGMIGAGFSSQIRRRPPAAGAAQSLLAAAALALCGLLGRRVEPLAGGVLLAGAAAVLLILHPQPRELLRRGGKPSRAGAELAVIASAGAAGYAAVMLTKAVAAGPSCFLGQCVQGDRLAELAATALAIAALAALAASRISGWRLPLWSAGLGAATLGASSAALPGAPGSLGILGGTAAVAWGFLLIVLGERDRRTGKEQHMETSRPQKGHPMNVLVAYATRHGATAGIAEHIAATLNGHGLSAEARPVDEVERLDLYDAVILGGAAYMFHWLKPAVRFARKHRAELSSRPVWLFSSGPLGTDHVDAEGNNVLEETRPKEFDELTDLLKPRGEKVFFGAYDPQAAPIGIAERLTRHMPAAGEGFPAGDFREWETISAWAEQIAADLVSDAS